MSPPRNFDDEEETRLRLSDRDNFTKKLIDEPPLVNSDYHTENIQETEGSHENFKGY